MFSSRKSVCEGYAQSFKKVCDLLDIEAVVIKDTQEILLEKLVKYLEPQTMLGML